MPLGRGDVVLGVVKRDDLVVRIAMDAMDHVAAHLPESDEAELHQRISFPTRTASSPWARSVWRSPSACARNSVAKLNESPGTSKSVAGSWTIWTNAPVLGPPLCSCPVECRKRG